MAALPAGPRMQALLRALLLIAALVLANLVFFRVPIFNGFTRLWGDHFDGGIEATILEHWYNVVRGYSPWSQTEYFYPASGTLGYNDGYFLYGLIHAVYRAIGFDIFVSSQLVDITIKTIGFLSFFALARHVFRCRFACALLGSAIFTIGHATFMHAFHQQLLSVSFAPLLAYLCARAYEQLARGNPTSFVLIGTSAALLYGAWLLTAYYMSWFFGLFAGVLLIVTPFAGGMPFYREAAALCLRFRWQVLSVLAVLATALIPFLAVYLPKASETGMHAWAEALVFAPAPNDAVNVGTGNFMFGRLFNLICPRCTAANYEELMGIPPILMYLFICGWFRLLFADRSTTVLPRAMAITTAVTWLLLFRFGSHSGWKLVYDFIPGAKGVRVVSRYQIFLTLPVVLITILHVQGLAARMPRAVTMLVCALLMLEQIGTSPSVNDRADELARIAAPAPPADCKAFFVTQAKGQDASSDAMSRYPHNVEAMLIAERVHLPTINGYSTFLPPGWDFADPTSGDYLERVRNYADRYRIIGLCPLNLETLRWDTPIT